MKRIALSMVAGLGLLALVPTVAMAHTDVSIGVNLGGGYAPQPVYAAPEPVYYGPAPVYYGPNVVYRGYDHRGWHDRRWEEHRWHEERRWHEDRGWHGHDRDDRR